MSDQEERSCTRGASEGEDVCAEAAAPLSVQELADLREGAADGALPLARVRASLGAGAADVVVGAAAELVGTLARQEAYRGVLGAAGFCAALAGVLADAAGTASTATLGWAARAVANLAYEDVPNRARLLAAGAVGPLVALLVRLQGTEGGEDDDGNGDSNKSKTLPALPPPQLRFVVAAIGNACAQHAEVSAACGAAGAVEALAGVLARAGAGQATADADADAAAASDALCAAAAQALENLCAADRANSARLRAADGAARVVALLRARRATPRAEHTCGPCAARRAGLALVDALALTAQDRGDLTNSAAWRVALADAGVLPALLDLATNPPFVPNPPRRDSSSNEEQEEEQEEEEEEEQEEQGIGENECVQESAAHMLAVLVSDGACAERFGACMGAALAYAGAAHDALGEGAHAARRLVVRSARYGVSRAAAQACAAPGVAAAVLAEHADALVALLAPDVDAAVRANALGAWALVAADAPRSLAVATTHGGAVVDAALAALAAAHDGAADAPRALRLVHNLLVAPAPRARLLAAGVAPRLVHVVDTVANPVVLFDAVLALGAAVADPADPADPAALAALNAAGAFRALAVLARAEKGVPEPDDDHQQQHEEEKEQEKPRDLRVAYEATRVLMRAMRAADEHYGVALLDGERGCVAALARIAGAPWAVLHRELADTLAALLARAGTRQALARAAAAERDAWDALVAAADTVDALTPLAPELRALLA